MNRKLTVLIIPLDAYGHVYPTVGIGQQLLQKGHRIVFAIEKSWQGKLVKYGFEEQIYNIHTEEENQKASEYWIKFIIDNGMLENKTPLEKIKIFNISQMFDKLKKADSYIAEISNKLKPDVVINDVIMMTPSIAKQKLWINLYPACPSSIIDDENTPPPCSGFPTYDKSQWDQFKVIWDKIMQDELKKTIEWFKSQGVEPPIQEKFWFSVSPHLNIYHYPKELDFTDLRPLPDNWVRFDSFIRDEEQHFEIPEKLKNKPGKLIYFSLGSIGSADVKLMKRLTGFMSESQHRFIISKGIFGDQYELPDNCWGENHVQQTKILEIVDLAIIHGGNNSLCETFYFGKPMIVMPLFADQFDNAQRVEEKGFGIRMEPYKCSKDELLNAIDKLLNDEELNKKIKAVAKRIENDIKSNRLVSLIEELANKNRN